MNQETVAETMTVRERVRNTFAFKPVDRAPFNETFGYWTETLARWHEQGLPAHVKVHDFYYFGLDNKYNKAVELDLAPYPPSEPELLERKGHFEFLWNAYGGIEKIDLTVVGPQKKICVKPAVENRRQFEEKFAGLWRPDLSRYTNRGYLQSVRTRHQWGDFTIHFCCMGFFRNPMRFLPEERYYLMFYDQPDLIHAVNERYCELLVKMLELVFQETEIDWMYFTEDIAGSKGMTISPAMFQEFCAPYYQRVTDVLRSHGVTFIGIDSDGDMSELIPACLDCGIDGFLPLQQINRNMDVNVLRQKYPKAKFKGGIDKFKLAGSHADIEREVLRVKPAIQSGGYIPGCDHQVPPTVSLENYMYYLKCLKQILS